jgi:hypothetical protein
MNIRSCDLDRYVRCINGKGNAMHGYLITDSNTLDLVSKALIFYLYNQIGLLEIFEEEERFYKSIMIHRGIENMNPFILF